MIFIISGGLLYWSNSTMKMGFVPTEDRGFVMMDISLAPGASMERTFALAKEVQKRAEKIEGVTSATVIAGRSLINGSGSNNSLGFVKLAPFDERAGKPGQSVEEITGKLFGAVADIKEAKILFFQILELINLL